MRYLPFIVGLALVIYALVDCVRHEDSEMPVGLPKAAWVVLILLFPGLGAIAWLVVSRAGRVSAPDGPRRAPGPRPQGTSRPHPSRRPTGPLAPDDDPEFLANLDRQRRERERQARAARDERAGGADGPDVKRGTRDDGAASPGATEAPGSDGDDAGPAKG